MAALSVAMSVNVLTDCCIIVIAALSSTVSNPVMPAVVEEDLHECITPVVEQLIEDKWDAYGRVIYYSGLVFHVIDLLLLSLTIQGIIPIVAVLAMTTFSHTIVHVSNIGYEGIYQACQQRLNQFDHFKDYMKSYLQKKLFSIVYCIAIICSFVTDRTLDGRTCNNPEIEYCSSRRSADFLGVASVFGWMSVLSCLIAIKFLGVPGESTTPAEYWLSQWMVIGSYNAQKDGTRRYPQIR